MPKQKLTKTKHKGIYSYNTSSGKRYSVRFRYKDSSGNWKEKQESGFNNLTKAKMRKAELEITSKNDLSIIENESITFGQWYKEFFKASAPTWSPHTVENFNSRYKNHFYVFANKQLSKITLLDVQKFINQKLADGYTVTTIKSLHNSMMQIINSAVKHDLLLKNKLNDVTFPAQIKTTKYIESETMKLVDDYVFSDEFSILDQAMFVLMKIGWRKSEVSGFRHESVEIINSSSVYVHVLCSRTPLTKEYGKTTKTPSSQRTNHLTGFKAKIIISCINVSKKIYENHNLACTNVSFVFINPKTGKLYSPSRTSSILNKCNKSLNVKITPHMLRHVFATNAIVGGENIVDVSNWIGHSDVKVTLSTYTHSSKESKTKITKFASEI